jgi:molybdopterin synthase catalytic subunit
MSTTTTGSDHTQMSNDSVDTVFARISASPLELEALERFVWTTASGAVVTFSGIVRNHDRGRPVTSLDYEAHPDAERFLRDCCTEVAVRSGLRVAAAHRIGSLAIGDTALLATVAAPHRKEAFEACAELVERIKASVPIWKRQRFSDGESEWVGL